MVDTNITRHQTAHHADRLASPDFSSRMASARLVGGGILTWDVSGATGIFTWSAPLYIEFPTMPWKIQIGINGVNPGSVSSIAVGETLYLVVPFVNDAGSNVDDVYPAGTWNVTTTPELIKSYAEVLKSTGPINVEGVSGSQLFFIGSRVEGDQFILHNDCILSDGVPGAIGSGSNAGSRSIIIAAPATDWGDIGILYAPNQRHLHVYVNGVYQKPARYDGSVVLGYVAIADADYKETYLTGGADTDTLYGGIAWTSVVGPPIVNSTPATDEIVICVLGGGAMGPAGPPGPPGGLQESYDNGKVIVLDYDTGTNVQDPIVIDEGLVAADITTTPFEVQYAPNLSILEVRRTDVHPDATVRDKLAFVLDSIGNLASSGIFLYNPYCLTTFENELVGSGPGHTDGFYFAGMDDKAGALVPEDKFIIHFLNRLALTAAGVTDPRQLQVLRQDAAVLTPSLTAGVLSGQFAVNPQGEVATGWARDFIRWHVFDLVFPTPGEIAMTHEDHFMINPNVIEDTAVFLGGFATSPIDADTYEVFYHSNPTNAYVGANPYELKLAMEYLPGESPPERWLHLTYGDNLVDRTAKVVLFFSAEYVEAGAASPDEGVFETIPI